MEASELLRLMVEVGLKRGNFILRSGRESAYYLDKYQWSCRPRILQALGKEIAARLPSGVELLAGCELGAVPLAAAVGMASGLDYAIVRKGEDKGYGTAKVLEGPPVAGKKVVLVEDVVTTGGAALEAAKKLQEAGATLLKVIAVFDRREGGAGAFAAAGVPFVSVFSLDDVPGVKS